MRLFLAMILPLALAACAAGRGPERLTAADVQSLLAGNTEFGELIRPSDPDIEGTAGRAYTAHYRTNGELIYRIGAKGERKTWTWRVSKDGTLCRGPALDRLWCRIIEPYARNSYRAIDAASRRHRYSFSVVAGDPASLDRP